MLIGTIIFILGLLIGSFLNVVILRIPEGKTMVNDRSVCRACGYILLLADLVPVASFLLLRGKCRKCGEQISWQYPVVELLTAVLFLFAYLELGLTLNLLLALIFISLSITVTFTDLIFMRIPNKVVLFGSIVAFPFIIYNAHFYQSTLGALIGGGFLLLIAIISRGNMGGGDIKLAFMQGLYLGISNTIVMLILSFIISGVISLLLIALKIKGHKDAIPFGPFLASAGLIAFFYGSEIILWYFARFY